ncbi:hypothetical protein ACFWOT_30935 [Streptomyces sp. NPDC058440]|uniref:hypothetical protein n=1 Tax=Streptomyces sp. NPDC058440 TaxID=3346501 RepID=UPI00365FBDD4
MKADDTPKRTDPPKSLLGRVCLVLVMLFIGVLFSVFGVAATVHLAGEVKYSTRASGTPGLLKIDACTTSGTGKQRHTDCVGAFRSDDHRVVDRFASIGGPHRKGAVLPVQRDAHGHCYTVGVTPTAWRLSVMCFCVLGLFAGLAAFCGAFCTVMPRTGRRIGAVMRSSGIARAVGGLCKALGVGIAVFGVVALFGLIGGLVVR